MRDLRLLAKAHLHLHLDGAMRPDTLAELAAAAGVEAPMPQGYGSFAAFTDTITAAARVLRTEAEVFRLLQEVAADAAAAGAVWIEVSVWPGLFAGRLGADGDALDVVLEASAAAGCGLGIGVIVAANRDRGPAEACDVARLAASRAADGVVGLGLDGDDAAHPPALFREAFRIAREAGLRAFPHAGELAGPQSIVDALDLLGGDRIMHGVRAVEDPDLVSRLAHERICLDVCPTSNVMLSVVPALEQHPLPLLLTAGVRCTINADDPLLFATDLLKEYERCRDVLQLTDEALAAVARTSLQASAAPAETVTAGLAAIETWLDDGAQPCTSSLSRHPRRC
jgi:adenosine deaminase